MAGSKETIGPNDPWSGWERVYLPSEEFDRLKAGGRIDTGSTKFNDTYTLTKDAIDGAEMIIHNEYIFAFDGFPFNTSLYKRRTEKAKPKASDNLFC